MNVLVVGAGIIGAACARSLAMAGCDVTVVERAATASGTSSSGEGNILVSDKLPGPELSLAQYALALWPQIIDELPDTPSLEYEQKGGLVVSTGSPQPLLDFAATQREAGIEAQPVSVAEALELEPDLNPAITAAVLYPEDAQVQPAIATEALLASARRHGARVLPATEVIGPVLTGGVLRGVGSNRGPIGTDHVVVAAGPWSGEVAGRLGVHLPVGPRRGNILVTAPMRQRIFHKVYDADYVGAVESSDADLQTSTVVESTKGGTVLIGSSRERVGFDDRLRVPVLRELAAKALRLFPFLAGVPVIRAYGGFRPYVPDHLPVIGADPRLSGLWHATGHEGAGIGLSVATGELIRDLILGRPPAIDPLPFSPGRFA
jgi:glycine/D-amino acid oxidase-like deaminating enzyme